MSILADVASDQPKLGGVRGVELFQVGIRGGIPFHEQDLDDAIRNFRVLSTGDKKTIDPALKAGHDKDQIATTGLPRLGSATDLWKEKRVCEECGGTGNWRQGDEFYPCPFCDNPDGYPTGKRTILKGSFGEVPRIVAEAVKNKAYKQISAEFYPQGHKALSGLPHEGIVFRGAGILGGDLPVVKTLKELSKADWIYAEMEAEPTLLRFSESAEHDGVIMVFSEVLGLSDINIMTGKSLKMDDLGICQASTHQNLHTGKSLSHADVIEHLGKHGLHATESDGLIHVHHHPDHIHEVLTKSGHETVKDAEGCTYSDRAMGHKFYLKNAEGVAGSTGKSGTTGTSSIGGDALPPPPTRSPVGGKQVGGYEGTFHPIRPEHQNVLSKLSKPFGAGALGTGTSNLKKSSVPWGGTGHAAYAEKTAIGKGGKVARVDGNFIHSEAAMSTRAELETILTASPYSLNAELLKKFSDEELVQFSEGVTKAAEAAAAKKQPQVLTFSDQTMAEAYHHLHSMGMSCEPSSLHHEGMKHPKETLKLHHPTKEVHQMFAERGYHHQGHGKFAHATTGHEYHTDHDQEGNVHVHKFSESASGGDDMTPAQVSEIVRAEMKAILPNISDISQQLDQKLNGAIAKFSESLQPIRDDVRDFKTSTHRDAILAFCEEAQGKGLIHAFEMDDSATDAKGKRLPNLVDRLMGLSTQPVYEFSEGGKTVMLSDLDVAKREIMQRPRWTGEKAKQGVPGKGTSTTAQSETMQEIIQFAETNEGILKEAGYATKDEFVKVLEVAPEKDRQEILEHLKKGAAA
jgi:hypothetical protein